MAGWGVNSEVKPLKRVVVHAPTRAELESVCRDPAASLFSAAPDVDRAIRQHNDFIDVLKSEGVDVIDLSSFRRNVKPNLMFTRDLAVMTSKGAVIGNLALPIRKGEEDAVRHFFTELGIPILLDVGEAYPEIPFEGGDFLYLSERLAAVGETGRTGPRAHLILAQSGMVKQIVSVTLFSGFPHLDMVLAIVAGHTALVYPPVLPRKFLHDLGRMDLNLIDIEERELRTLAANVLATKPGRVIAAVENVLTNQRLRREGIDVIEVTVSELLKGRGGPRCLTLPLERR